MLPFPARFLIACAPAEPDQTVAGGELLATFAVDGTAIRGPSITLDLQTRATPDVVEWWRDAPNGIEQGFHVTEPDDVVEVAIDVTGRLASVRTDRVHLAAEDQAPLFVDHLVAWDARGVELPAWFEATDDGFAIVVDSASAEFPVEIDPIYSTVSAVFLAGTETGRAMAGGDFDADGYADVVAGGPGYDSNAGSVSFYFGDKSGGLTQSSFLSGVSTHRLGESVAAGDVNGDGYDDAIVGAPGEEGFGFVHIYWGGTARINGKSETVFNGAQPGGLFGYRVDSADVNGDGLDDVLVTSFGPTPTDQRLSVFHGSKAGVEVPAATVLTTTDGKANYASAIADAGDVNTDGYDDILVASPFANSGDGYVELHLGSAAGVSSKASTLLQGFVQGENFGRAVDGAGDVNGDGYDDMIVGAPLSKGPGRAYVFHGGKSVPDGQVDGTWLGNNELNYGMAVAGAGDLDANGYDDVLVGSAGSNDFGAVYEYTGSASGVQFSKEEVRLEGIVAGWGFGEGVAGLGDVNGDGFDDIAVGSPRWKNNGVGEVHLGFGSGADVDGDGVGSITDCNDNDKTIHPGAVEVVGDGVDQNCDGQETCYTDSDQDGFRNPSNSELYGSSDSDCADPGEALATTPVDCDDNNGAVNPSAQEVCSGTDEDCDGLSNDHDPSVDPTTKLDFNVDADLDGWGTTATAKWCERPSGYATNSQDCDDTSATTYPGANEVVDDGIDQDCNGGDACYWDADEDGYVSGTGQQPSSDLDCLDLGEGAKTDPSGDCRDDIAAVHPGVLDECNSRDDDCDGDEDEDRPRWYMDLDADTYGNARFEVPSCTAPVGHVASKDDCDDVSAATHPNADEVCNGADDDCDGAIDDSAVDPNEWYPDADHDGHGTGTLVLACDAPTDHVASNDDCDDDDLNVRPGAAEVCNHLDEDCDGVADDDATDASAWHLDADGDGVGGVFATIVACEAPAQYVASDDDCDDLLAAAHPGAAELCDGHDDDCDGVTPADEADGDGDGARGCAGDCDDVDARAHPGAVEVCDGIDDDCDGDVDEHPLDGLRVYPDEDGDGFGAGTGELSCDVGAGFTIEHGDCDDADPALHPHAQDIPDDDLDQDCDGEDDPSTCSTSRGASSLGLALAAFAGLFARRRPRR